MSVTAVPIEPVKRSYKVWLWAGILVAVLGAAALAWYGTRAVVAAKGTNDEYLAWNLTQPGVKVTASGLQYQVIKPGTGAAPKDGDVANVSIEGKLRDGTVFQPRAGGPFPIQPGAAIPGFYEAMKLMPKGSHYKIWIPSKLSYDAMPGGGPAELAGQVLMFDVEMKDVKTAADVQREQAMQQEMMRRQMEQMGNQTAPAEGPGPQAPPTQ
jgi:FKBP-type peptidyl-prolyl cis-trans isomerase FkpA